eukprot:CAMPEP_0184201304 /NCGR_PEP_ID=MMETSP0976-20121227/7971_1 /TAXON_ID=483370 /ORGANISM="non described non described, Strain CCMP2097" /LENGTH=60 /DNA_ID=CAMNT_0026505825 /DNA_START=61 /DNA_END=243 /DNA_ORIENTATION=-
MRYVTPGAPRARREGARSDQANRPDAILAAALARGNSNIREEGDCDRRPFETASAFNFAH